jgi:hypothetical protein
MRENDNYEFSNNFSNVNLNFIFTLNNLSILSALKKTQIFTFIGFGSIWSNVEGSFTSADDALRYYNKWGDSYFAPEYNENNTLVNARSSYLDRDLTIPFGLGIKRSINKWLDLGLEWRLQWTRSDNLDAYSFPIWENRHFDYFSIIGVQASVKIGKRGDEKHIDWLNPIESILDEIDSLKGMSSKITTIISKNKQLELTLNELNIENNKLENLVQELSEKLLEATDDKLPSGTVYKVQMGYFKQLNLQSFNGQNRYIKAEDVEGAKRYTVGFFQTVDEAMQFANDVKKLGIQDAFVTQYINGERNMTFDALKIRR